RRVILATNVAETSLTVPRIGYVIDTGTARMSRHSHRHAVRRLPVEPISQASAMQRLGRAGRLAPGVCVRLYSQDDFESRPAFTEPEIARSDLSAVLLQLAALGLRAGDDFPFLDAPDRRYVNDGYRLLIELGAMSQSLKLTAVGRQLARLPVDPRIGRMLLAAREQQCIREMLIVASALSVSDPRAGARRRREAAREPDEELAQPDQQSRGPSPPVYRDERSDFMTLVGLWERLGEQRRTLKRSLFERWCERCGLSMARLREWREVHDQLRSIMREVGLLESERPRQHASGRTRSGARYGALHRALLTGLLRNAGMREDRREYVGVRDVRFRLSGASALAGSPPKWVVAAELVETTKTYAHLAARVRPEWVERAAGDLLHRGYFDAHWDEHRAEAMVYERTSLYGLTITPRRRVRFSPVSRDDARELFIRAALVEGQWRSRVPVLARNRATVADLRRLDHKFRRPDVSVRDEDVYRFYEARLPADVVDGATFEANMRRMAREQPGWLQLEAGQIRHAPEPDNTALDFPDQLVLGDLDPPLELPLTYCHAPGDASDGVTACIPRVRLGELDPERLEWLVPGLLAEKVTALLRALPKSIRRELMPLPDVAQAFASGATGSDYPVEGLRAALRRHLRSERGIEIPATAWPVASSPGELPAHFAMRFKVIDEHGGMLAEGRDLAKLQVALNVNPAAGASERFVVRAGRRARRGKVSGRDAGPRGHTDERPRHRAWRFGSLPRSRFFDVPGGQVERFPALADRGDGVCLEWCATPVDARRMHREGLRRLLLLSCPQIEQAAFVELSDREGANRALSLIHALLPSLADAPGAEQHAGRSPELAEAFELALCDWLIGGFAGAESLVTSGGEFEKLCQYAGAHVMQAVESLGELVEDVLMRYHRIAITLDDINAGVHAASVEDARRQLVHLVHRGFLLSSARDVLEHLPRYLDALALRLEKLTRGGARDAAKLADIDPLWARYVARAQTHAARGRRDPELSRYRWMLEEYRVSVFAQELGTAYSISRKRLDEQWGRVAS
ncbi:MAG: ATP-dependent RNA helicase HrpA, partial [Gammaproteobacteria bacterium]